MLSQFIKENTQDAHKKVEGTIVRQLKNIRNEEDYAQVLKGFYSYFLAVETEISKFIDSSVLPDLHLRRNSNYIKKDIETLGANVQELPFAKAVTVHSTLQALSSLYVLEGSIMGGPYIVQMLKKYGLTRGFSFFEGYGEDSATMWSKFSDTLNQHAPSTEQYQEAVDIANKTFFRFEEVFLSKN